ncbi:uncharacterized protein LOC116179552 [Photinus pyralis]|uniref:uncharacterized protein LOC116179552 n=1 Tax=Photinus pyralis TaxID=7054 RepID=UPI0012677AAF|nr:uncharacterized protein LOC116179552 [Photinus pyralis]
MAAHFKSMCAAFDADFLSEDAMVKVCEQLHNMITSGEVIPEEEDIVHFRRLRDVVGTIQTRLLQQNVNAQQVNTGVVPQSQPVDLTVTNTLQHPTMTAKTQSQPLDLTVNPHVSKTASENVLTQSQPMDLTVKNAPRPATSGVKPNRKRAAPCVNNFLNPQHSTSGLQQATPTGSNNINSEPSTSGLHQLSPQVGRGVPRRFLVLSEGERVIKKFNLTAQQLTIKFDDAEPNEAPLEWLKKSLTALINYITKRRSVSDRIGLMLTNSEFPDNPLGFSFRRIDQLNANVMLKTMDKVMQSNKAFFSSDALRVDVSLITLPNGKGRQRMTGVTFEEFSQRKHGIIIINNNDTLCLARALVTAIAFRNNSPDLPYLKVGHALQTEKARELYAAAGVDLSNGGTIEHIRQFQDHLTDYTIVVYNHRMGKTVYFEGLRSPQRQVLNLLMENEHYNVITSLTSAFSCSYFCESCRVRMSERKAHKNCKYICPCCHNNPPCNKDVVNIKCAECNRDFRGQDCYRYHKDQNLCSQVRRCRTCLATVWKNKKPHKCGFKLCVTCNAERPIRHLCYMAKNSPNKKKLDKDFVFVFYDFECRQDEQFENRPNTYVHIPNLCVAQHVCKTCIVNNKDINMPCDNCGNRQHIFKTAPVDELLSLVSSLAKKNRDVVAIAHNSKGYDSIFILKEMMKTPSAWNPEIIATGTKITSLACNNNIRFIDSLNFIPIPLSAFPKTFNFEGSKGHFPHFFNTVANQDYVGPMPAPHFYGCDEMSAKNREDFLEWYNGEEIRNAVFDFQAEIVQYCIQDVNILRRACVEFWHKFVTENKVDPFRECCTIASACSLVFRRNFLQEETIGLIPHGGYRASDNQSKVAIKWLLLLQNREIPDLQHAGNTREVRLKEGIIVDGYSQATNTVYQFHGCYFHGCERCHSDQTAALKGDKTDTMGVRREKTEATSVRIRAAGYNLVEMWECDFKTYLINNPDIAEFLENHNVVKNEPLNPRDGFFGGRTNAVKLYHKTEGDEVIRYLDVCSLYPYVNKYAKYPVGHPRVLVTPEELRTVNLNSVEGIMKCTVLPPQHLYHPVLPYRCHGKLMFPLCRTCCETMEQDECEHSEEERRFSGTYVADELRKAISLGYVVEDIQEVWEYRTTKYDKATKSGGLFTGYVDNFLKTKQECSGWPSWCVDEEACMQYLADYMEHEGIQLDRSKIAVNAGLRYIAKLFLNSFWGKFGQRDNLTKTAIVSEPEQFFQMLTDPAVELNSIIPVNDETLIVNWTLPEEAVEPLRTTNVVLAAYTTAHARLKLYSYLEQLGERVLYFDTDSVIFTENPGEWSPACGNFLGDMTDEVECYGPGSRIVEFVSGGPKNYAFKVFSPSTNNYSVVCKVKGISLNYKNSAVVNFETIKDAVLNNAPETFVETDRRIARTCTYDVISKPERKRYRVAYTKRRRIAVGCDTLPYGYKK